MLEVKAAALTSERSLTSDNQKQRSPDATGDRTLMLVNVEASMSVNEPDQEPSA